MRDRVKNFLRQIRDLRGNKNGGDTHNLPSHEENEVNCGGADLNRAEAPSTSKCEPIEEIETNIPRPNIATILLVALLLLVFVALPVVYLLHCFDLLHTEWPRGELGHVIMDHSHPNPRSYKIEEPLALPVGEQPRSPPLPAPPQAQKCSGIQDARKFDCHPEFGASEETCKARGCCWVPRGTAREWDEEERRQVPNYV